MTAARVRSALVGYVLVAALTGDRGLPAACPYRLLLGRPCPFCGLSRAVALAARGHWRGSLRQHPLGIPLLALAAHQLAASPGCRRANFRGEAADSGAY